VNIEIKGTTNRNNRLAVVAAFVLYVILIGVGSYVHEPWRDESHAWLIVQMSRSVKDLFFNSTYEGHPSLWFLLLYGVKILGGGWVAVQFLHGLLAATAVYLMLRYAPFTFEVRILLMFSYFFSYEYAVIARDYAVGVLLLFLLGSLFSLRHQKIGHILWCSIVMVLCQTNVFALLVGCGLYGTIWLELLFYRFTQLRSHWPRYAIGLTLVLIGFIVAVADILTPPDGGYTQPTHGPLSIRGAIFCIRTLWSALMPFPATFIQFWNSNLLDQIPIPLLRSGLRLGLLLALLKWLVLPLFRSRLALIGWITSCVAIEYIFFAQYFGSLRHHGHLFLSLLMLLWVQPYLPDFRPYAARFEWSLPYRLWLLVLGIQVLTTIVAYRADIWYPFSMNQLTAQYIQGRPIQRWFRVGYQDYSAEGVATYLANNRMYYPESGEHNGFIRWTTKRHVMSLRQVLDSVAHHSREAPALLVLNRPVVADSARLFRLTPIKAFTGSIVADEQYWLYKYYPK